MSGRAVSIFNFFYDIFTYLHICVGVPLNTKVRNAPRKITCQMIVDD